MERRPGFPADLEISPAIAGQLERFVHEVVTDLIRNTPRLPNGRVQLAVTFRDYGRARTFVLAHGGAIKVIGPRELELGVRDFAEQTMGQYPALGTKPDWTQIDGEKHDI